MYITDHFRNRGIKRKLFPVWLSPETIDMFAMQKLNQVSKQRISKCTGMLISATPGMTIVTTPDMKTAITTWRNKIKVAM
jgi:hypothetical protein